MRGLTIILLILVLTIDGSHSALTYFHVQLHRPAEDPEPERPSAASTLPVPPLILRIFEMMKQNEIQRKKMMHWLQENAVDMERPPLRIYKRESNRYF